MGARKFNPIPPPGKRMMDRCRAIRPECYLVLFYMTLACEKSFRRMQAPRKIQADSDLSLQFQRSFPRSVHLPFCRAIFSAFSRTRKSTIVFTSGSGRGASSGNCTAPLEKLYPWNSFSNARMPLAVGDEL